jgi:signal peptidase I
MAALARIRRSKYAKTIISIAVIIGLVVGFFFGLQLALNNPVPLRVVESSSMSVPYNFCPGPPYSLDYVMLTLMHPFDRTLNVGDIIIIQGVDPTTLNTNYPNSDIIVYQKPNDPTETPVVHRIASSYEANGTLYFQTKGDGNGPPYPAPVDESEYDSHRIWHTGEGVPENLVVGRVVMRIPYLGWITLLLRGNSWGVPLIVALIFVVLAVELILPVVKSKRNPAAQTPTPPEFALIKSVC